MEEEKKEAKTNKGTGKENIVGKEIKEIGIDKNVPGEEDLEEREKKEMEKEKREIEKEIKSLPEKRRPFELEKMRLEEDIKSLEKVLEPILKKEKEAEEKKYKIEQGERNAKTEAERREWEKKRWQSEDEREKIEKEKWFQLNKIEKLKNMAREAELKIQEILEEKKELERRRKEIIDKENETRLRKEKEGIEKILRDLLSNKSRIEKEREEVMKERERIETELSDTIKKEKEIEEEEKAFEEEEKMTKTTAELKKVEEQIVEIERERRKTEARRWELEDKKVGPEKKMEKLNSQYKKILDKERVLETRLKEINKELGLPKEWIETPQIKEEPAGREGLAEKQEIKEGKPETETKAPEAIKTGLPPRAEGPEKKAEPPKKKIEPGEEKLRYLKRAEVRTMKKDIRNLKEMGIEEERERILTLGSNRGGGKNPYLKKNLKNETGEEKVVLPNPPKKPSKTRKTLIRAVVILLFFILSGLFYWYLLVRRPSSQNRIEKPPIENSSKKPGEKKPQPAENNEIIIHVPASIIPVEKTVSLEISNINDIPKLATKVEEEKIGEGDMVRFVVKNRAEKRLVYPEEISQIYQVDTPDGFFQTLKGNFTLALFGQKQGKRLVFLDRIKDREGLINLLKKWEGDISKRGVFISGSRIQTLANRFKQTSYDGVVFRYLTISKNDVGLCYTLLNNYFVFTTSFESMKTVIRELKPKPVIGENKLGQLFILGFEGKTLSPRLESFLKKYKPGGVLLLSKNIGSVTELKRLISGMQSISLKETGLPLFVAVDQEGGEINRLNFLEEKTPQSKIKSQAEAYQVGLKRGRELSWLGVNLNLAPLLDDSKKGDFIFSRSFQKPPETAGGLAKSLVLGQKKAGIMTAIKHFPGYGGIRFNPEGKLAIMDNLPEIEQFKKAMEAKPEFVMASNVIYKKIDPSAPLTFSEKGIQFLKSNLGDEPIVLSDDLDQDSLLQQFTLKEIVTRPLEAGVDILIFSGYRLPAGQAVDKFMEALRNKEISRTEINKKIMKIIKLKEKMLK